MRKTTREDRERAVATPVTLDGQPAKISGIQLDYAIVRMNGANGIVGEWSWETAVKIADTHGRFTL